MCLTQLPTKGLHWRPHRFMKDRNTFPTSLKRVEFQIYHRVLQFPLLRVASSQCLPQRGDSPISSEIASCCVEFTSLPDKIVRRIVEVLGSKGRTIYGLITWVTFADDMLLNEVHPAHPSLAIRPQSVLSCVSPAVVHTTVQ